MPGRSSITAEAAARFDMLRPLVKSFHEEMGRFAKQKQEMPINEAKVKMINRVLTEVKELVKDDPVAEYLVLLEDEELPLYSDVQIILGQYLSAMDQFRNKHERHDFPFGWNIEA